MRCKENPYRFCPVIDRGDFIAGLLIGVGVGFILGWLLGVWLLHK